MEYDVAALELAEMISDHLGEAHDLTLALARFEHRILILGEAAGAGTAEAGAGEFLKRIAAKIVEFWSRLKDWLAKAIAHLRSQTVGPRMEWLRRNEGALREKTDFGGAKVQIGKQVDPSRLRELAEAGNAAARKAIGIAMKAEPGEEQGGGLAARLMEPIREWAGAQREAGTINAAARSKYIGDPEEHELNPALVEKMISVAKVTWDNYPALGKAGLAADDVMESARRRFEGGEAVGDDAARKAAVLRALSSLGPMVATQIGAALMVNGIADSQAMHALVAALRSA